MFVCNAAVPVGILSITDILNIFKWNRLLKVIVVVLSLLVI